MSSLMNSVPNSFRNLVRNNVVIVAGTDTGIGKTVVSAGLAQAIGAAYWKPVQSGLDGATDTDMVQRLGGVPVLPEAYRLALPASPHLSAAREGVCISLEALALPDIDSPLVVEGAGGVLTPLNRDTLFVDAFRLWNAPVVLVARTSLGTINHTLLSLEALRARGCRVAGIIFSGDAAPDSEDIIPALGGARRLGRLPHLEILDRTTLRAAFGAIDLGPVREAMSC